jgi:hypothetical protein
MKHQTLTDHCRIQVRQISCALLTHAHGSIAELLVLNSSHRAHGAACHHGDRNGCLKGTRESVLNKIESWARDFNMPPIFWLNGLAGMGKSTIAQTIAERVFAEGHLGGSFFCSRGFEDRSNLKLIFPTLAFQLAQKHPAFRSSLIHLLQSNPDAIHKSLQDQMEKFLVKPLQSAAISTVLVIDALDECKDKDPESAILLVLGQLVSEIPGVKFFITSRPEAHVVAGFRGPLLQGLTNVFVLHDIEPHTVNNDIRHFFKHKLSMLVHRRGSGGEDWPTDEQLNLLCQRAAGLFVYAAATVKFLNHKFLRPSDRLDVIMKSPESTSPEGMAKLDEYTSLDFLYMSILQAAFLDNDNNDDGTVRSIIGAVILAANPLSPSMIAALMGSRCDQVQCLLESIQSLLTLAEDPHYPVQPFHKSFPDFITDPTRCIDRRFHIPPDHYHSELALNCITLMDHSLKRNMCSLPDYILNSKVRGLQKKVDGSGICGALEYACRWWSKHLVFTKGHGTDIISSLSHFLEHKFLFWLEVMSILGAVGDAARALVATKEWLGEVCPD